MIARHVQRSPTYDAIISEFVEVMNFIDTQKDLVEHCKKFITALTNVGGSVKIAALMIQQEWIDILK